MQSGVWTWILENWDHLARLWHDYLAAEDCIPWRLHPPRKTLLGEKDGVARLKELTAPAFLGNGYGEGQAKLSGEVEFGARVVLPPTTILAEATKALSRVAVIGSRMARHPIGPAAFAIHPTAEGESDACPRCLGDWDFDELGQIVGSARADG